MNWQDSAELGRQEAGIGENARTMDTQGLSGVLSHVGTHCHGSVLVNGQTFCDLPTHLHHFSFVFHAIRINK